MIEAFDNSTVLARLILYCHVATKKDLERFSDKIIVLNGDCWIWNGSMKSNGYGEFRMNYTNHLPHRISYSISKGEIPTGSVIHHTCKIKKCVNPEHLKLINKHDHGPNNKIHKTHCIRGHELLGDNLYTAPNGRRSCKTCKRLWDVTRKPRILGDKL